ncbi:hypothetical protein I302_103053 [Kwoniella bestiolae CBS 10118]|uniref:BZIP domain-containing protein n=1 Tax=Kwoniella bestiolae CBS 10118 TaxID=1296100 RepID=A0A1B9GGP1_9TREE|nr:hypothetical protein I302_01751 [Kwoniella bestiolae CBS 10118]OCF30232.1 hypothetical protein I302_01751 [Kwoniella bestiolae CBS 10118]
MSPTSSLSSKSLLSSFKGNSTTSLMNMSDDMDGRTRNAKAQKRHREKQKARVKALEESVQVLTAQLEDARRQLGQLPYPPGPSRMPIGSHSPEFAQLQNENSYLRDENSDLRRQLYTLRVTYGQENPGAQMPSPPPRHGSGQGQGRSNTNPAEANASDPYRNSSGNGNRSRVLSASSAPSASPYVGSSSFPADLRAHSLSNNNNSNNGSSNNSNNNKPQQIESNYPVRYEGHMYPPTAPPPHALPRSQMYNVENMPYGGGRGEGGENMPWGPESGPPPFTGSMGYPAVNFHENSSSNNVSEPWRQDH